MGFQDFLASLQQAVGIGAAIGFLMTFVLEWMPNFEYLSAREKRAVFFALCMTLPLLAAGVGVALGYYEPIFETTFWPAVVAGFTAFTAGTLVHTRKL